MMYPPAFLRIQVAFARRMAELAGVSYDESVLRNTALYRILGLDWTLDPSHPVWRQFINELRDDDTECIAAYRVYSKRHAQGLIPDYEMSRPHWGCFSYEYHPESLAIRLHFANRDTSGAGPLSSQRIDARMAELRAMFTRIRQQHPGAESVRDGSWLYNRAEYRRLFPRQFGTSARVDSPHLLTRALWGQFLRHDSRLNEDLAARFLRQVAELRDAGACATCFPSRTLITEAAIPAFYAFYGISGISGADGGESGQIRAT